MIREWKPKNRDLRLKPHQMKSWCDHCDRTIVNNWQKCPICGKRSGKKTLKKWTNS